jgi:hypothetical protein
VVGDPLERAGAIVARPVADESPSVSLVLLSRRTDRLPRQVRALAVELAACAARFAA